MLSTTHLLDVLFLRLLAFPAISLQLASALPSESVVLNAPVKSVVPARAGAPATVRVAGGRSYAARKGVVIAVGIATMA